MQKGGNSDLGGFMNHPAQLLAKEKGSKQKIEAVGVEKPIRGFIIR